MFSEKRLLNAYTNAHRINFSKKDKFILFSDCHRGDNSFADDFSNNRNIYFHALNHYFENGYTYCELGDGDELWENKTFKNIFNAHKNVYGLLQKLHINKRLHMIWGNHDMAYKNKDNVNKNLSYFFNNKTGKKEVLFENLNYHEAIVLKNTDTSQELFLCHGHQADWWNYIFWKWSRFFVRVLWKPLQIIGISDPTSPAKNFKELIKLERKVKNWIAKNNNLITIIGHTHRPRFPRPGKIPFFNTGSCVHPRCITGIEIANNEISLIKWEVETTKEGFLHINKTILEDPTPIRRFKI